MLYGTVKLWNDEKNFGFIEGDDDVDYFVQRGDLTPAVPGKRLRSGQRVGFDVRSDMKGDRAVNVRLVNQ